MNNLNTNQEFQNIFQEEFGIKINSDDVEMLSTALVSYVKILNEIK